MCKMRLQPRHAACTLDQLQGVTGGLAGSVNTARCQFVCLVFVACRAFGSAAIVAGAAAQVLEFNPQATPAQVLQVLQGDATRDAVMDAGAGSAARHQLLGPPWRMRQQMIQ